MTAEELRPTFEQFGSVEDITIILDKTTRISKGDLSVPHPVPRPPPVPLRHRSPRPRRVLQAAALSPTRVRRRPRRPSNS